MQAKPHCRKGFALGVIFEHLELKYVLFCVLARAQRFSQMLITSLTTAVFMLGVLFIQHRRILEHNLAQVARGASRIDGPANPSQTNNGSRPE